jgi:hypothetical protein
VLSLFIWLHNNNNNNNNNNNSIRVSGYLLMCRLNSTNATYKASTNTTQNSTNTQNKILNRQTNDVAGKVI